MKNKAFVNELLQEIKKQAEISDCTLDERGICAFTVRGEAEITIELLDDRDALLVYSPMTRTTVPPDPALMAKLLARNLMGKATHGAAFAYDENTHVIFLQSYIRLTHLTQENFLHFVLYFMHAAMYWRDILYHGVAEGKKKEEYKELPPFQFKV